MPQQYVIMYKRGQSAHRSDQTPKEIHKCGRGVWYSLRKPNNQAFGAQKKKNCDATQVRAKCEPITPSQGKYLEDEIMTIDKERDKNDGNDA